VTPQPKTRAIRSSLYFMKPTNTLLHRSILFTIAMLFTALLANAANPIKVAWTPYPSWQILPATTLNLDGKGAFLDRRMKETGGKVEIVKFKEYTVSITAMVAGEVDACAMTLQEALSFAVDGGVPVTVILVNDYSNGNDAVFGPPGSTLKDLETNPVLLEEFSVSQYVSYRALQTNDLDAKKLQVRNTPGDEIPKVFLPAAKKPFAVTWNPHVVRIQENAGGNTLFTSANIPGEVIDAIVIRSDRIKGNEASIEALVKSYYDFISYWQAPATAERATRALASTADMKSPEDVELFKKTVTTTRFYYTPQETAEFMDSPEIRAATGKVRDALITFGAFKGQNPEAYQITFDSTWVKKAAASK
jgi:NitT/TauT family transport system substrate-binding protein